MFEIVLTIMKSTKVYRNSHGVKLLVRNEGDSMRVIVAYDAKCTIAVVQLITPPLSERSTLAAEGDLHQNPFRLPEYHDGSPL